MKKFWDKWLPKEEAPSAPHNRMATAIAARQHLVNDFFGGWNAEDIETLHRYQYTGPHDAGKGEILDWLGIRTDIRLHAWLPQNRPDALVIRDLPIPDDQVHAETIEYIALLAAIERARSARRGEFVVMELGASYAPWAIASGVLALRSGFPSIKMVAVEANKNSVPKISEHAKRNGLLDAANVRLIPIHGAVHTKDEPVYFPKIDTDHDNGAQISLETTEQDYRGVKVEYEEVPGVTLATLASEVEQIDLLHMDLQGAEESLLSDPSFLNTLNCRVRTLFLATQSRLIEGIALKTLSAMGWKLYRERPTVYQQNERTIDVNGWTLRDGGQIWFNPNLDTPSR